MEAKETKKKKKRKRSPKAYYYPNGIKTVFTYKKTSDKLSPAGLWLKEHPDGIGEILDMKAVMK
ncbi:MAG: hypothetical protein FWF53_03160 [Candidatus Azobacteroides sp.]|nr:hypothetical protein [Candidatus Azobacteroides sp.]